MKVKLLNDAEIELTAIPLSKRNVSRNVNKALALASKLEDVKDTFGEEFTQLEDEYLSIATDVMKEMEISIDDVAEADVVHILVFFRTGKWRPGELGNGLPGGGKQDKKSSGPQKSGK